MEQQTTQTFESWAIIELFGHNVIAGLVSEQTIGGAALIRVDVPEVDDAHPAFTKFYGGGAIYAMTPTTEAHAREAAAQIRVRPVALYILPGAGPALPALNESDDYDRDGDEDEDAHKGESKDIPF